MNRRISRLAVVLIALYVVLFAQLNVVQVASRERLQNDERNTRQTVRDFNDPRGDIVTDDGVVIATSNPSAPGDQSVSCTWAGVWAASPMMTARSSSKASTSA